MVEIQEWSPYSYKGASKEFKKARLKECGILIGRSINNEPFRVSHPSEMLPYSNAISQFLSTILAFNGISPGAFSMLLKDIIIFYFSENKVPSAVLAGLADRFLDNYFGLIRSYSSETFVQSFYHIFRKIEDSIKKDEDLDKEYLQLIQEIAHNITPYGLGKVPGIPNAEELYYKCERFQLPKSYVIVWKEKYMALQYLIFDYEKLKIQESNELSRVKICESSEELLERLNEEIERLNLYGPIDRTQHDAPTLGDYGASQIYRLRVKNVVGEIISPFYSAKFEKSIYKNSSNPFDHPDRIEDIIIIAKEDNANTSIIGINVENEQLVFEYILPFIDKENILTKLPGMGYKLKEEKLLDSEKNNIKMKKDEIQTFIVHGHSDIDKLDLKNYLWSTLGLPEPIILHEQPNLGRTIIEKFEDYAKKATLVFVLLTPDDKISETDDTNDIKRRARQNVIFEMGYFLGKLSRESGRILLLHKGKIEIPSDISGVCYIDISNGILRAGEEIRKELKHLIE